MLMFCPQCGSQQSEELKFCKLCGANLRAVLQVMATRETSEKFDWGKTWVAEMFLSEGERKRREEELERQRGITPEVKRYKEIKAGVITGCVGIGAAIVLYVLMQGIILSGNVPPGDAEILSRLWVAGVIPLFVGIALIINGLFVSKRLVEIAGQRPPGSNILERDTDPHSLRSAGPGEFIPSGFSVTEETTRHLGHSRQKQESPNEPKR
jgi:hypothetical protein